MADPINLSFPLRKSSKGAFETNQSTLDAIRDDLRILLLTNHGERPIHYDFGANLRRLIFEQSPGVLQQAEDLISAAVEKWMPFVKLVEIKVENDTVNPGLRPNELKINLKFSVGQLEGSLEQRIRN